MAEQNGLVNIGRVPYEEHSGYYFEFGSAIQELMSFKELNIFRSGNHFGQQSQLFGNFGRGPYEKHLVMIFKIWHISSEGYIV